MRRVLRIVAAGAFLFAPGYADALVRIDIDLSRQRMHVESGSGESYDWPISSGRAGHLTPRGSFRPIALYTMVHSLKYDNAPMPHSIFFLPNYAIHGTNAVGSLGRPASHGCIRLAPGEASLLFDMVRAEGATIGIRGQIGGSSARAVRRRREEWQDDPYYAPAEPMRIFPQWDLEPTDGY
jgi:hypothetical protein